jgi:TatD DNase family protein
MYIDIGANLTDDSFVSDRDEVISNAFAVGVSTMIVTGSDERHSAEACRLSAQYPNKLFATAGVHPHYVKECHKNTIGNLRKLAPEVKAIGECGLDYFRDISPRSIQKIWFEKQLELAIELGLPVFLHQRDAHKDFFPLIKKYQPQLKNIVVHCFTGTKEELHDYLSIDCYIGLTGWICDERRGLHLHGIVKDIPQDRIMIETDSPYLLPRDLKPKPKSRRNEPKFLPHICKVIAHYRGEATDQLAQNSSHNAKVFFNF